jgi:anti-anti-sigma regulatory factor
VVFSFFKKDPKHAKDRNARGRAGVRARPVPPKPLGNPAPAAGRGIVNKSPSTRFATTENAITNRDLHKSLAMETAAKIDAIESEMARDFLRPSNTAANSAFPPSGGRPTAQPSVPSAQPASAVEQDDSADAMADDDLGSIDAIEISTSGAGSVIDETAILFANGQAADAQEGLRAALAAEDVGPNVQTAWHMLFELVNQSGDRAAFEQLTMDYVLRFENSPPAWLDYDGQPAVTFSRSAGGGDEPGAPVVRLPATIDAGIVKPLETLKAYAATHAALSLDVSATRSIDLVGAELLLRVINAFKRASHELTLIGLDPLCVAVRAAVEAGRRDASDAGWMLLLEVLRLLGKQHDFEETGIQYCITFEVSPPSWEPAPLNMKVKSARAAGAVAAPVAASANNPLEWRGLIEAEGEPHFGRLAVAAREHKGNLVVECRHLRRMAFSAGSALLTLALRLQQTGVTLEFRNVNALIGALLHLLGVTAVTTVHLRRG